MIIVIMLSGAWLKELNEGKEETKNKKKKIDKG